MNKTELNKILKLHKLWLNNDPKGRCADLQGADLLGATLRGATLYGANLRRAILEGADLEGADLRDSILEGADLRDSILEGANLQGADLRDSILVGAILRSATFNKETIFPIGFDPIVREMKSVDENAEDVVVPPKTLHEELSTLVGKYGFALTYFGRIPGKREESAIHIARLVPSPGEEKGWKEPV